MNITGLNVFELIEVIAIGQVVTAAASVITLCVVLVIKDRLNSEEGDDK